MKTAFVAPFFSAVGGSTKVDQIFGELLPSAEVFALFARDAAMPESLRHRPRHLSFLNSVPYIHTVYRALIGSYPVALENMALEGYDLIVSSDHNLCKGILKDQHALHICYCHTPWHQLYTFRAEAIRSVPAPLRPFFRHVVGELRRFDYIAAQRVDLFIANSKYIAERIHACYQRESTVIYPPVDTSRGFIDNNPDTYYLSVGRLSHTKRIDLLIHACNELKRRLIIVGTGRKMDSLKGIAGPTIELLGHVPDQQLRTLYAQSRALLFAANEDFGIVPVEAQSFGRPVIAYGHGGSLETVVAPNEEGKPPTGIHFADQTASSVRDAILRFEAAEHLFTPALIREHACSFDTEVFRQKIQSFVQSACEARGLP